MCLCVRERAKERAKRGPAQPPSACGQHLELARFTAAASATSGLALGLCSPWLLLSDDRGFLIKEGGGAVTQAHR